MWVTCISLHQKAALVGLLWLRNTRDMHPLSPSNDGTREKQGSLGIAHYALPCPKRNEEKGREGLEGCREGGRGQMRSRGIREPVTRACSRPARTRERDRKLVWLSWPANLLAHSLLVRCYYPGRDPVWNGYHNMSMNLGSPSRSQSLQFIHGENRGWEGGRQAQLTGLFVLEHPYREDVLGITYETQYLES